MKRAIFKSTILIVLMYFSPLLWSGAGGEVCAHDNHLIDSLELQLKRHSATKLELGKNIPTLYDSIQVNILNDLCVQLMDFDNDTAMFYAKQLLLISENSGYKRGVAKAYFLMGKIAFSNSDFTHSNEHYKKAIKLFKELNDNTEVVNAYLGIGKSFIELSDFPQALKNLIVSLKIAESCKNKKAIAYAHLNIGIVYYRIKKSNQAFDNWQLALKEFKELGDEMGMVKANANLGNIFLEEGEFNNALDAYMNVTKLCETLGNKTGIAMGNSNIANVYYELKKYPQALNHWRIALNTSLEIGDKNGVGNAYGAIGEIYVQQHNYKDGQVYLRKGINIAYEVGNKDIVQLCYKTLSNLYQQQEDFSSALKNYKSFIAVRDSLYNEDNAQKIDELQLQYETEKKEQQIALLTKESKLQKAELQKQNTTRNAFIGGFALVALLAGISYNRYRIKHKANAAIENTLVHLKNTQEQLIEREKLASLGKLTVDVAKQIEVPVSKINQLNIKNRNLISDLKNNVGSLSNSNIDELKDNLRQIYSFGKDADGIVKKVLTETRKVQG